MGYDDPYCVICYEPIAEYGQFSWYVEVRRLDKPLYVGRAHHTCPPERADDE